MDKKSWNKRLWNPSAKLINYFARFFCKKKRDSINFVKILVIQNCFYYRQCLGSLRVTVWKISEQLSAVLFLYLYCIWYRWIILPVQTIWKYTSNWVVASSSVSPEAPLMVQSTIIFLFRICLGVLINLLRIHNSIYQNNGILPFSLLAKAMRKELCWDSRHLWSVRERWFLSFWHVPQKRRQLRFEIWPLGLTRQPALRVCFLSSH